MRESDYFCMINLQKCNCLLIFFTYYQSALQKVYSNAVSAVIFFKTMQIYIQDEKKL